MMPLIIALLWGGLGAALSFAGLPITTWGFWVILLIVVLIALVSSH